MLFEETLYRRKGRPADFTDCLITRKSRHTCITTPIEPLSTVCLNKDGRSKISKKSLPMIPLGIIRWLST